MTNAHALPDLAPAAPLPAVPLPALPSGVALPGDEHYARNLIGGRWQFPAAPFEFEIRNPLDSTVTTVVPLSSRFDVARAVTAARAATRPWSSDGDMRHRLLTQLVDRLEFLAGPTMPAMPGGWAGTSCPGACRSPRLSAASCRTCWPGGQ